MGDSHTIAAYGVVTNRRHEILLTRRRNRNEWVLPGGSVESGRCVIASPISKSAVLGCMTRFRMRQTQSTLIGPNAMAA